mmetsp:Transcript_12054/g.28389  ORF Transcript_12054/g.28389 Transcript_12054/m.28389 type:complete len:270 (+) Transcript_12054:1056-1865(+)
MSTFCARMSRSAGSNSPLSSVAHTVCSTSTRGITTSRFPRGSASTTLCPPLAAPTSTVPRSTNLASSSPFHPSFHPPSLRCVAPSSGRMSSLFAVEVQRRKRSWTHTDDTPSSTASSPSSSFNLRVCPNTPPPGSSATHLHCAPSLPTRRCTSPDDGDDDDDDDADAGAAVRVRGSSSSTTTLPSSSCATHFPLPLSRSSRRTPPGSFSSCAPAVFALPSTSLLPLSDGRMRGTRRAPSSETARSRRSLAHASWNRSLPLALSACNASI